eukprot:s5304_g4.t1
MTKWRLWCGAGGGTVAAVLVVGAGSAVSHGGAGQLSRLKTGVGGPGGGDGGTVEQWQHGGDGGGGGGQKRLTSGTDALVR